MLKKFLSLIFAALFVLGNFTQAHAAINTDAWINFGFDYKDTYTGAGELPDNFQLTDTGFTCSTRTIQAVMVDGRKRTGRLVINWEFEFQEDGVYYDNDYEGDDEDFESALAEAIVKYVTEQMM